MHWTSHIHTNVTVWAHNCRQYRQTKRNLEGKRPDIWHVLYVLAKYSLRGEGNFKTLNKYHVPVLYGILTNCKYFCSGCHWKTRSQVKYMLSARGLPYPVTLKTWWLQIRYVSYCYDFILLILFAEHHLSTLIRPTRRIFILSRGRGWGSEFSKYKKPLLSAICRSLFCSKQ